jgi:hypothetical protein
MDPTAILQMRLSLLERKVDFLLRSLNLEYVHPIPEQMKPIVALLRQGRRKEALDAWCEATNGDNDGARAAIAELELTMK